MATVTLKNVMKIYPHSGDQKKKKAKKGETPAEEKKVNLQGKTISAHSHSFRGRFW